MVVLEAPRLSALTRLLAVTEAPEAMMLLMLAMMVMEAPAALDMETDLQVKTVRVQTHMAALEVMGTMDTAPAVMAETMTMVRWRLVLRAHPGRMARY